MSSLRKLDPTSPHYLDCYTLDELAAYREGRVDAEERAEIFYHLNQAKCEHCRKLFDVAVEVEPDEKEIDYSSASQPDQTRLNWLRQKKRRVFTEPPVPIRLEKGQVWLTGCEVRDAEGQPFDTVDYAYPVMVVDPGSEAVTPDNSIRVVPLSVDTDFVWPGHSFLLHEDNPLGYSCLAEIFNERPMLAGNLKSFCGSINLESLYHFDREREFWLAGTIAEPDADVSSWELRELELSAYLSAPVNAMVWEGEELEEITPEMGNGKMAQVIEINRSVGLVDYALAAASDASTEISLQDAHDHILHSDDELDVVLLQERDRVSLVIISVEGEPENFIVNGEVQNLETLLPEQYIFTFSPESIIAGKLQFSFMVVLKTCNFMLSFPQPSALPEAE